MSTTSVVIAGASGLVGGLVLDQLCADPEVESVTSVGRRTLERAEPKLRQLTVDFANLAPTALPAADVALCALGTTAKKAGSAAAFRAVDFDAVVNFARAAHAAGTARLVVVSALGANPRAHGLYNKVKGEAEAALREVGFASLAILRPSLLLADRTESRPAERAAIVVSRALSPLMSLFDGRPIDAQRVVHAMVRIAKAAEPGTRVYESGELQKLGAAPPAP
jgi:uncharacterized protein YbjT (DUF2867 family)